MSARWVPSANIDKVIAQLPGLRRELLVDANVIAAGTASLARDHRYRPTAELDDQGNVRVVSYYSFAHWDEWGTIHNTGTAAMRRSAERVGRLVLEPKPTKAPSAKHLNVRR